MHHQAIPNLLTANLLIELKVVMQVNVLSEQVTKRIISKLLLYVHLLLMSENKVSASNPSLS